MMSDTIGSGGGHAARRPPRADARRNVEKLLEAAQTVFSASGLDAPIREIADRAGVGIGTLYRHFPRRADLVAAVFRHEIEACAAAAPGLLAAQAPFEALKAWTQLFVALAVSKRGLAGAALLGDPAFKDVPERRENHLRPAFRLLFDAAVAAGDVRPDIDPDEFMDAISSLCMHAHDTRLDYAQRMVALFLDGLRPDYPVSKL
jgi:AcrR family transcriptional regulator